MKEILMLTVILTGSYLFGQKGGNGNSFGTNIPNPCQEEAYIPYAPHWSYAPYKIYTGCNEVKVGIGIINPQYLLDVNGDFRSHEVSTKKINSGAIYSQFRGDATINAYEYISRTNDLLQLGKIGNGNTGVTYVKVNSNGTIEITPKTQNSHFIAKNNVGNVFEIDYNGGVKITNRSNNAPLIITANNGNKILQLENNGLLRARRIRVDTDTWADYVFVNGYKLLPLQEVANFIAKNGHLPNIPSAEYLKKHGVDINKMLQLQMEKIEELTLYTIEQDNQLNTLNTKVDRLEKELAEIKAMLKNK